MNKAIDDLTPLTETPDSRILIGGDFNAWKHSLSPGSDEYRAVFERLAALGVSDCIKAKDNDTTDPMPDCCCGKGDLCGNARTMRYRTQSDSRPWQNAYIFASAALLPSLRSWTTLTPKTCGPKVTTTQSSPRSTFKSKTPTLPMKRPIGSIANR